MKSVMIDFLVSAGIKPTAIVSYNHLGNNDGKNLQAPQTFRSKEISKSNVVDDMVGSNRILYKKAGLSEWSDFHPIMSLLSYMIKAPLVPPGTPVVNALFTQRCCIENIFRACVALPPVNHMALEHKRGVAEATVHAAKKQKKK